MYYNEQSLDNYFEKFKELVERKSQQPFVDFNNSYIKKYEGYKYNVDEDAVEHLQLQDNLIWKQDYLGHGKILNQIISAIEIKGNNLIQWDNRYGKEGKQHKIFLNPSTMDKKLFDNVFFNFYKNKISPEKAFDEFLKFTSDYRLISYFFFIKKKGTETDMIRDRYSPIVPTKFDKIFGKIGVENYSAKGNCSFENYKEYHTIIKEIRAYLINKIKNISLLDTHSFLWIIGDQLEKDEEERAAVERKNLKQKKSYQNIQTANKIEPVPQLPIDEKRSLSNNGQKIITQEEYLEIYKKQLFIGKKAEQIVEDFEREYFKRINRYDLAESVKSVADDPSKGYDISSWEVNDDGSGEKEKQIEVKTIRLTRKKISFFLTNHELKKSSLLLNYYIYCVQYDSDRNEHSIVFLKNPDLNDSSLYYMQPIGYEVTFENLINLIL